MSGQRPFEVGDEVYLIAHRRMFRVKVERATKTKAIAGGAEYWRDSGRRVGAGELSSDRIHHPNVEIERRWRKELFRLAADDLRRAACWGVPAAIRAAFAVWDKLEKEVNDGS